MSVFFTAAVWCVPALRVPLVHSLINHFRHKTRHIFYLHAWRVAQKKRRLHAGRVGDRNDEQTHPAQGSRADARPPLDCGSTRPRRPLPLQYPLSSRRPLLDRCELRRAACRPAWEALLAAALGAGLACVVRPATVTEDLVVVLRRRRTRRQPTGRGPRRPRR